jgi:AcrR family transcriptional regulator
VDNVILRSHFVKQKVELGMSPRKAEFPPVQKRSRKTLERLLDAAEFILARHGLQGATLPRIAARARLSPASVYRRFRDKDALVAAVFERLAKRSSAESAAAVNPEAVRHLGLKQFSSNIIAGMIRSYRADAGLSRAALQYAEQHWNADSVRYSRDSEARSFQQMVETFLIWRDQITHPQPELAIRFAFVMVALALRELILFDRAYLFEPILPIDDELLASELTRVFLQYLGIGSETKSIR